MTKWNSTRMLLIGMVAGCMVLGGCATYSATSADMRSSLLSGQFDLARDLAEQQRADEDVLAALNTGMLRRMTGDYTASNQAFEHAKRRIDQLYGVSVTDQLGAITINDTLRDYKGDRYEQVLLHAYMAMNDIQLGELDAARVEMLQADVKMREWGDAPEEDAFVRYLAGIIFEMLGENDQALVSYRKAYEIYKSSTNRLGLQTPAIVMQDLLRLLATLELWDEYRRLKAEFGMDDFKPVKTGGAYGEVIVVLNIGLAPQREENAIMTFSNEVSSMVRIALPAYNRRPEKLQHAQVNVSGRQQLLETVENVDALARHALNDDIAIIASRAIARAVVKHKAQREVHGKHGELAGLLITMTNIVTERADTRSWTTLPQEIQLTRLLLPEGQHQVNIEIINAAGRVIDSMQQTVVINSGQRVLLCEHWIAPSPVISARSK